MKLRYILRRLRARWTLVEPGEDPLAEPQKLTGKRGRNWWLILGILLIVGSCAWSTVRARNAKADDARRQTTPETTLAAIEVTPIVSDPTATPTITPTTTPTAQPTATRRWRLPSPEPSATLAYNGMGTPLPTVEPTKDGLLGWIENKPTSAPKNYSGPGGSTTVQIKEVQVTVPVAVPVTVQVTRVVTQIVTATPGPTQTPWIVTATAAGPTATLYWPTDTPPPTWAPPTEAPTLTPTWTPTWTPTYTPTYTLTPTTTLTITLPITATMTVTPTLEIIP
jgi:hypothetical protein